MPPIKGYLSGQPDLEWVFTVFISGSNCHVQTEFHRITDPQKSEFKPG